MYKNNHKKAFIDNIRYNLIVTIAVGKLISFPS